jgi:hypothetical protein
MAAKKTRKDPVSIARVLALAGDADGAIAALTPLAETDASAAASLAELLAFRGDWDGVVTNAARLMASPSLVYAGNVVDDMVRLVALAGHHGVPWARVAQAATAATAALATETRAHIAKRLGRIFEDLEAYAARSGAPPHERIAIFTPPCTPQTRARYDAAVALADKKPKAAAKAEAQHRMGLASTFDQHDELLRLVQLTPQYASFAHWLTAARYLASTGDPEAAWTLLSPHLSEWSPVDYAQVAPVDLLTDPVLCELITSTRAASILATPRGTERTQ